MQTAREHFNWCIERAMQYADAGDMPQAWASFASDVRNHPGTEHIASHLLFQMAMFSGVYDRPAEFRVFISGWAVTDTPASLARGSQPSDT